MKTLSLLAMGLLSLGLAVPARAAEEARIGRGIDFTLRDYRGKVHALDDYKDSKLVVLVVLGTQCPLAKSYAPRLADLAAEFESQGVTFLGVNPNQQDSITAIAAYARIHKINFPILKDVRNELADRLGAIRTPEVFVLDGKRRVRYWGRIDDQYGFNESYVAYQLPAPRRRDLAVALDELLAGKEVSQPITEAPGCHIGRIKTPDEDATVTYSDQIVRIFNDNCVFCHRDGQIAPFPLTNYEESVGWAEMIDEVVREQRMPPWHADPRYGHFDNDARLTDEEKALIYRWVDSGAPEGDPADLPEPPQFTDGWMIPEPDEVIYMSEEAYTVPAEGTVAYQRFVVDPGWDEDKWITAIEPKPDNASVVHHIVMYIQQPRGPKKGAAGRLRADWLAAFAPGLRPPVLEEGYARYIRKGSKLVFELHYTPNGSVQQDRSYLGIKFADPKVVKKEVAVKNAGNFTFKIPAGESNHRVDSYYTFREDSILLSVSPHMHVRGKDFEYNLIFPDGREEKILSVPNYDFAWQTTYFFDDPKILPKGTKMHCVAHFDNSEDNLNNPDPTKTVTWGEQTWEEMMFGWFEMALVDQDLTKAPPEPISRVKEFLRLVSVGPLEVDEQIQQLASRALKTEEDFKFASYYLADIVPQIDRVCITFVEDGKLRAQAIEELNGLRSTLRSVNTRVSAKGQDLAAHIDAAEPVVHADLSQAQGSLMKRMVRKGVHSSLHVPVTLGEREVTVNFWSTEANAFPPAAVKFLAEVARLFAAGS